MYFAVSSFLELVEYIFKIPGVKVFLSERLSQDTLEQLCGCQRQRGKSHENPNMEQFCKGTQAFRVINGTCGSVMRGNCKGNKAAIDWEQENCPLPKRKRHRLASTKTSSCKNEVPIEQSSEPSNAIQHHKIEQPSEPSNAVQHHKIEQSSEPSNAVIKLNCKQLEKQDQLPKPVKNKPAKSKQAINELAKPEQTSSKAVQLDKPIKHKSVEVENNFKHHTGKVSIAIT